jgi:asparagine synthase (glutamine-hydrolysing)
MCGFTAVFSNKRLDLNEFNELNNLLHHRGPDAQGQFMSENGQTLMFHNRLSFQDVNSRSNQPFLSKDRRFCIVFNGEIYNYRLLQQELKQKGISFSTNGDTEVIIEGFMHEGSSFFNRLEGMFAFVIFDALTNDFIAARDRFGIKPLFYYYSNELVVFSSEIKGILAVRKLNESIKIRKESVALFLANRYVPTPFTMWDGIYKLTPATFIQFDFQFKYSTEEYWKLEIGNKQISISEYSNVATELIEHSVKNHLVSDVEIGGFLSGGLDSSTLAMIASKNVDYPFKTFSIGFKDWNESEDKYAKVVADKLNIPFFPKIACEIDLNLVKKLMYYYDDPIADISILPTFEVSKLASEQVKAVLSGEGADEILGGYWWDKPEQFYFENQYKRVFRKLIPKSFPDIKQHYIYAMSMGLFDTAELKQALKGDYLKEIPDDPFYHFDQFELKGEHTTKQIQYLNIKTFMSELVLQKIDRASMANSLEVRVPFLDTKLVEYFMSLSPDCFMKKGIQKPLLQSILASKIPESILQRKKQGFVGPDKFYMDINIYENALKNGYLINEEVINSDYLNRKIIEKDYWRLWKLFVLECWWANWKTGSNFNIQTHI